MSDHLDLFVDEAMESIAAMNNALLALEDDPTDEAATARVFRHVHTLKGNAAALGYDEISELAHTLEDLLHRVRDGTMSIDAALMDEIFDAVDGIESMLGELDQYEETRTEAAPLIDRLCASDGEYASENGDASGANDPNPVATARSHASVTVGEDGMPGLDATFAIKALESAFDEFDLDPPRDTLEAGQFDGSFEVATDATGSELARVLAAVPHVEDVELATTDDDMMPHGDAALGDTDFAASDGEQRSSIRVDIDRLVELNELVEQLVTSRIRIQREFETAGIDADAARHLEQVTKRLRDVSMEMRLVPFDTIARGFPRVARDTARKLDKDIEFCMDGTDVEVDRRRLTRLKDPLIHVIRNAVDHGIEAGAERNAAGKPPVGRVDINVRREGDEVVVAVQDDGGGIDVDAVRQRALSEQLASRSELAGMSEDDVYELLFHPGFSTASEVTEVSGRGVGMDVVRERVVELDGSVTIESEQGEGTVVRFRLPVPRAVDNVMLIRSNGRVLGIPISDIEEVMTDESVERVHGEVMVKRHDSLSPVIDLETEFQSTTRADGGPDMANVAGKTIVLIRKNKRDLGLACDAVIGQEEVVVKPLVEPLSGTPGVSGTAALGDQQLVPIIDVVNI